jgi:hypothetical protein
LLEENRSFVRSSSGRTDRMRKFDLAELGRHVRDHCDAIAARIRG